MVTTEQTRGQTIETNLFIHATPERVFRALTEKAEREQWFLTEIARCVSSSVAIAAFARYPEASVL